MSEPLVTLVEAQNHLRIPLTSTDDDLFLKIAQAEAVIRQYLERIDGTDWDATMAAWTSDTVPPVIKAAILCQVGELYRFRGDDLEQPAREPGYLSPLIRSLLARYRDPVLV